MGSGGIAPPFLISALNGDEWYASFPNRFASGEITPPVPIVNGAEWAPKPA
jgi:hypothetical protein